MVVILPSHGEAVTARVLAQVLFFRVNLCDFHYRALNAIIALAIRLPSSVVEQLTCNEQVIRSIRMGGSSNFVQMLKGVALDRQ